MAHTLHVRTRACSLSPACPGRLCGQRFGMAPLRWLHCDDCDDLRGRRSGIVRACSCSLALYSLVAHPVLEKSLLV
jgi:hypothetical protein